MPFWVSPFFLCLPLCNWHCLGLRASSALLDIQNHSTLHHVPVPLCLCVDCPLMMGLQPPVGGENELTTE